MTPELASWRPLGDAMAMLERRLGMKIRQALPSGLQRDTPEWERGTRTWEQAASQAAEVEAEADLILTSLTWRLRDTLSCSGRGMSEWRFHGIAWHNDARIDFSGECLRDAATGGFWEFRLHALGFGDLQQK